MARTSNLEQPFDDTHCFQSKENHFPVDIALRRHGFKIHSRKKDEPAVWSKGDKLFTEMGAVRLLPEQVKEDLIEYGHIDCGDAA